MAYHCYTESHDISAGYGWGDTMGVSNPSTEIVLSGGFWSNNDADPNFYCWKNCPSGTSSGWGWSFGFHNATSGTVTVHCYIVTVDV
jgi:hypothetical protein